MPIVSFSINENLREFINKLVSRNQYENKSKLVRDALLRLMSSMDVASIETFSNLDPLGKTIIGNLIIVMPHDFLIMKKLNKIEAEYKDYIISKNQHFQGENAIIFMIVETNVEVFQRFVVEINGIEEVSNFRYMIMN
ncbi:MAG: CopG family ribbon-helix-helix protein [Promethearchaeota archaeon]